MRTPRSSSLNQATRIPASTACWPRASRKNVSPVPEGRRPRRFPAGDPFQRPQRLLGRGRDGGRRPGPRRRRSSRSGSPRPCSVGEHGPGPAGGFLGEEGFDDLGRFPALGAGGRDQVRCQRPGVGHFQGPHQRLEVRRQRRSRGRSWYGAHGLPPAPCPALVAAGGRRSLPTQRCLGSGTGFVGRMGGGAADVGVQDRGEVLVGEAAIGRPRSPRAWSTWTCPAILASATASAIFTFHPGRAAAVASNSQVRAPSPMVRNPSPRRSWSYPVDRPRSWAGGPGKWASSIAGLPGRARSWRATSTGPWPPVFRQLQVGHFSAKNQSISAGFQAVSAVVYFMRAFLTR